MGRGSLGRWGALVATLFAVHADAAGPPKKRDPKPSRPKEPWSLSVTTPSVVLSSAQVYTPLSTAPTPPATDHERSISTELRPGDASSARTVRLATTAGAEGRVQTATLELFQGKAPVQKLPLRVEAGETAALASLELVDLDFDGWLDVRVLREHGAKWGMHAVRTFDPKAGRFVDSKIARKLSELPNVEVLHESRRLVSTTIGPADPSYASYEVVGGDLVLEKQCVFKTSLGPSALGTLIVTKRDGAVTRERRFDGIALPPGFPRTCDR